MDGIIGVADSIRAEFQRLLPVQRKTQRNNLSLLVATILDVRSANLMGLAAGLPRDAARVDMRYQWIERVLKNPLIDCDAVMAPFTREVLCRLAGDGQPLVLISGPVQAQRPPSSADAGDDASPWTTTGQLAKDRLFALENVQPTPKRATTNIGILQEPGHTEPWIIAMEAKPGYLKTLDYSARWAIEPSPGCPGAGPASAPTGREIRIGPLWVCEGWIVVRNRSRSASIRLRTSAAPFGTGQNSGLQR